MYICRFCQETLTPIESFHPNSYPHKVPAHGHGKKLGSACGLFFIDMRCSVYYQAWLSSCPNGHSKSLVLLTQAQRGPLRTRDSLSFLICFAYLCLVGLDGPFEPAIPYFLICVAYLGFLRVLRTLEIIWPAKADQKRSAIRRDRWNYG